MVLPVDNRTEAQKLRSLVENGVAKRFDLRAWSDKGCAQATAEGLPGRQVQVPADPSSPVDSRPGGKWEMPPPIADERAWRERTT